MNDKLEMDQIGSPPILLSNDAISPTFHKSLQKPIKKKQPYVSKQPNQLGYIDYTEEENFVWRTLYTRQLSLVKSIACDEFLHGLEVLKFSADTIPQIPDVNQQLLKLTGWRVKEVPALIGFERFFELLANRCFPAATFIRRKEELDYIQEPDIFHELFGHCPLLTNKAYADFSQHYGELGLKANKADRAMLARLYWFTIEFGLLETTSGLKIYGGGILSSKEESEYSIFSSIPNRKPLDIIDAFRTHYRIDELQKNYFILPSLDELQTIKTLNLFEKLEQARKLGMHPSPYLPKENAAC